MSSMLKGQRGGFKPKFRPRNTDRLAAANTTPGATPDPSTAAASPAPPPPASPPPASAASARADASNSPQVLRTTPAPSTSSAANAKEPSPPPQPSPKPAAQPQPEQNAVEAAPSVADPVDNFTAPSTATSSRPKAPSKATTVRAAKASPRKAIPKPTLARETTETIAPTAPSSKAPTPAPSTPAEDDAVPSIENGEGSSSTAPPATLKAKDKGKSSAKTRKPAAAAKKSKKRKAAQATGGEQDEAAEDVEGPPKKKRAPPKKAVTTKKKATTKKAVPEIEAAGADDAESTAPRQRSQRQRKAATYTEERAAAEEADLETEGGEYSSSEEHSDEETDQDPATDGTKKKKKKTRTRGARKTRLRKRAVTPEDAENLTIDPTTMTLGELTKDIKIGRRWDKAALIEEAEREKKRERAERLAGIRREAEDEVAAEEAARERASASAAAGGTPTPAEADVPDVEEHTAVVDAMRVVNGQIVVDMSSLEYDRYADADKEREGMEEKEEHDFSRHTTQATFLRKKMTGSSWSDAENEKFYHGLRMFGTDFGMVAKMFGGAKTRSHIKNKFNREERLHPQRINACLVGAKDVAMDLDALGDAAEGLEPSADIEAQLKAERDERDAQAKLIQDELAAEAAKKREELMGKKGRRKGGPGTDPAEMEVVEEDHNAEQQEGGAAEEGGDAAPSGRGRKARAPEAHPGAKYGVGTDPDVIDETDLPEPRGGRGRGGRGVRGRGGRGRGQQINASGFGA